MLRSSCWIATEEELRLADHRRRGAPRRIRGRATGPEPPPPVVGSGAIARRSRPRATRPADRRASGGPGRAGFPAREQFPARRAGTARRRACCSRGSTRGARPGRNRRPECRLAASRGPAPAGRGTAATPSTARSASCKRGLGVLAVLLGRERDRQQSSQLVVGRGPAEGAVGEAAQDVVDPLLPGELGVDRRDGVRGAACPRAQRGPAACTSRNASGTRRRPAGSGSDGGPRGSRKAASITASAAASYISTRIGGVASTSAMLSKP